ncbi:MAG: ABC transporter ATP-binding protein/permease [Bacteroidia bacterium]|nr:ABC transporter ATP-binding protein/permease [Bacteroidia bacterium]
MKGYFTFIKFTFKYKYYALMNIVCNVLSSIFGLFSIALVIPLLEVLFSTTQSNTTKHVRTEFDFNHIAAWGKENVWYYKDFYGAETVLLFICGFVVIMIALKNVFRYLALFYMVPLRNFIISDYRIAAYNRILVLPLSYFSKEKKGDLLSRMTSDLHQIEVAIMSSLEAFTKEPITIIISLVMLIWVNPMLTLIVFSALPISALFAALIGKLLKKQSARSQSKLGDIVALIEETLMGVRVIKAFNAQDFLLKRFLVQNKLFTDLNIRANRTSDGSSPISETISIAVFATILWIGGKMVLSNEDGMTASVFIGYLTVFSQLMSPAKAFSSAYNSMNKGLASIERVDEIINSQEVITEKPNAVSIQKFNDSIEFKNVSFKYDDDHVIQQLNLTIKKGQTVALVGPSGSGKSTLTDLIPRFYDPTEGQILIDGKDLRDYKILELRGLMGIVTQESILFNDTIANNISFAKQNISKTQIEEAAKIANAHSFIIENENGYETNIGDRGNKLSGGQKQRLSIARAVNTNPDILILDEATSALDTASERLVQEALNNIMLNRTTIIVAHRLSTIINADLIVVLEKGRIVQQGTHNDLIQQDGTYKQLIQMQQIPD